MFSMRILSLPAIVISLALALCSAVAYGKDGVEMSTNQAFQIIANPSSSTNEFGAAITLLDPVAGERFFWLALAGNDHYTADRRRRFIKHYFKHFVSAGMTLGEVEKSLGKSPGWISYFGIREYQRADEYFSAGVGIEALENGKSGFSIPILSEAPGDYHLVIFICFKEDVKLEDLVHELGETVKGGPLAQVKIASCEGYDSDDDAASKVISGNPNYKWTWD